MVFQHVGLDLSLKTTTAMAAAGGGYAPVMLAATPDDAVVFVSGNSKLLVLPVK